MASTTLLMVVAAVAGMATVHGLPQDRGTDALRALHGLKIQGERVLKVDELPKEMRQAVKEHSGGLTVQEAAAGDGEAWSAGGGDNSAGISPALLASQSSSGISEEDVAGVSRRLQALEAL